MHMKRKVRFGLYSIGIVVFGSIALYHTFEPVLDRLAIRRVQHLAQDREEFKNRWLGVGVIQYPSDLITYAQLLYQIKPEVIVETGTNYGGLAVYFATLMEQINPEAKVLTVDIDSEKWDKEVAEGRITPRMLERIVFIKGDSVSEGVLHEVLRHANGKRGLVLLDSLHSKEHVLKELNLYSKFVAEGSYLIVNDTHLEVLGIMGPDKEGALSAVQEFLKSTNEFVMDPSFPGTIISCSPSGFLKRNKSR